MALIAHSLELEKCFGVGPHTVSFPRLEPALNMSKEILTRGRVSDEDFKKIILVIRLAIPYVGMILTARESAQIRREALELGVTQMDASTKIDIGGYQNSATCQKEVSQQFILGDTRTMDDLIRELALRGYISSFCTAGYRCGRTGKCIMELLRKGEEGKFCKLNAILTFREWLDDFASDETRKIAEPVLSKEVEEAQIKYPDIFPRFKEFYDRIVAGERDLYI